jgi:membrane-associated protease RseP (regulator of RpoE activity)
VNLFAFDFDTTFTVFFLNADERLYGRFGGRDGKGSENRMSLAGLHYAMEAALDSHARFAREPEAALPRPDAPRFIRQGVGKPLGGGRCLHCHQVKEILQGELRRAGKWTPDDIWRYPLPDNLGLILEIDRGNVVQRIEPDSSAARAGLQKGDVVQRLNDLPVHSFADATFALDRAPKTGIIPVSWKRGEQLLTGELKLHEGWKRTDISWRTSMQSYVAAPRLWGPDLSVKDKEALGLSAKQLAFRQGDPVNSQAGDAGIKPGDIIVGVDGKKLEMDSSEFIWFIRRNYVRGDRVTVNVLRQGEKLNLLMTLR